MARARGRRGRRRRSAAPSPPPSPLQVSPNLSQSARISAFCDNMEQRLPGLRRTHARAARFIVRKENETDAAVAQALRAGSNQNESAVVQQSKNMRLPKGSIKNVQNVQVFILTSLQKAKELELFEEVFDNYGELDVLGTDTLLILDLIEFREEIDKTFWSISNIRNNIETLNQLTSLETENKKGNSLNPNMPENPAAETDGESIRKECAADRLEANLLTDRANFASEKLRKVKDG